MTLTAKHKKTIRVIRAIYEHEIAAERVDAIMRAMDIAVRNGTLSQSDVDSLIFNGGFECMEMLFGI